MDIGILFLDGFKDIGVLGYYDPSQSTSISKVFVNNYVDKSRFAQLFLFGIYWLNRKSTLLALVVFQ